MTVLNSRKFDPRRAWRAPGTIFLLFLSLTPWLERDAHLDVGLVVGQLHIRSAALPPAEAVRQQVALRRGSRRQVLHPSLHADDTRGAQPVAAAVAAEPAVLTAAAATEPAVVATAATAEPATRPADSMPRPAAL